ncbi:formin [Trypanosoma conorhini]|uniref:Formin n=1 Tax=Trypanosoma conorhini TaxID=83891 RepID=A0A3R7L6F6_9TRYP|nr:formin [Trypanosoma conorhini]RNF08560.1 formin [Trypanosoma conorhini]
MAKSKPAQTSITRTIPIEALRTVPNNSAFKSDNMVVLPEEYRKELIKDFKRTEPKPVEKKQEVVKEVILDPNRERNVGIVLQFLRLPIQTVEASVRMFDELTLGEEHVSGLAKIIPNAEDIQAINAWMKRNPKATTARLHQLSIPVRFFMMVTKIEFYAERLQCWNLKNEFKGRIDDLEVKIRRAMEGVSAAMDSPHLPRMLQFVLAVSNVLNTGSRFQGAKGFRITQLPQIIDFPTTNSKGVLLDHLIEIIDQQDPAVHRCTEELLPAVEHASNFDVPGVAGELKSLRARLQKCASLVRAIPDDKPWTTKLGKFIYTAFPALERVEQLMGELTAKIELMPVYFCENPASFQMNDTLRCLANFAKKYNAKRAQLLERQELLSEPKAAAAGNPRAATHDHGSRAAAEESRKEHPAPRVHEANAETQKNGPPSPLAPHTPARSNERGPPRDARWGGRRAEGLGNASNGISGFGGGGPESRVVLSQ